MAGGQTFWPALTVSISRQDVLYSPLAMLGGEMHERFRWQGGMEKIGVLT